MSGTGGRGYYIGQIPPTLPKGQYDILYFKQTTAGSGSLTDTPLGKEILDWMGSSRFDIPVGSSGYSEYGAIQATVRYDQADISCSGTSLTYFDGSGTMYGFTLNDATNPRSRTKI